MPVTASWYHLSVKAIGRSAGRSVVAAAAYRLGERLHDEELGQTHDYTRRGGVRSSFTLAPDYAPSWALQPADLWNQATGAEKRINSKLAREIELALPAKVEPWVRERIVRDLAQALVDRYGVAVTAAIHDPSQRGDQANFHSHILFTTRRVEAEGMGKKTRELDDRKSGPQEVLWLREHAANLINTALEEADSDERVDHRSFADRGIDQEPTQHLGPQATEMERRGEKTDLGDRNREAKKQDQWLADLIDELKEVDEEIAQAEERKLDDRYGPLDEEPIATAESAGSFQERPLDAFGEIEEQTAAEAQEAASGPSEQTAEQAQPLPAFEAVERETISQAIADQAATDAEEASGGGGRFARVRGWWDNMREYVSGWRDTIKERASHYLAQWERDEMRERDAEYPHDAPPAPLQASPTAQFQSAPGLGYEPSSDTKSPAPNPGMDLTP